MLSSMLSSLASSAVASSAVSSTMTSTGFIIGSKTIIGTIILIGFLLIYEVITTKKENKRMFMPLLFILSIIFLSVLTIAIVNALK